MKKKVVLAMLIMLLTIQTGCGNKIKNIDSEVLAETVNQEITKALYAETDDMDTEATVISETDEYLASEEDYEEFEYFFGVRSKEVNPEVLMDLYTFDKCSEDYYLPESIPIYFEDGYLVGYTKPDIEVTVHSKKDGWYEIQLGDYTRLAKAEEFDTVAVVKEDVKTKQDTAAVVKEDVKPKQESVTSAPTTVQPSTSNNEAISSETIVQPVEEPVIETPVAASTKYTPEEAIAVYRSIMEANGITWNPDLKNGGSWGTGWIYLEKGQPEWAGNSSVESFKMGDSVGNSWDSYYLEVTDSDANAVYYTKWHP